MMLMNARPGWGSGKVLSELAPEKYAELRAALPGLKLPEDQTVVDKSWHPGEILMDDAEAAVLTAVGIELSVSRIKGLSGPPPESWKAGGGPVTHVSVANIGLFAVRRVEVLENACTYDLQSWLNRGWRLLAVCPPNDQRRPDYILGHTEAADGANANDR